MTFIDKLLINIVNEPDFDSVVPVHEVSVLRSLAKSASGPFFLTENQSRLVIRLIKEAAKFMPTQKEQIAQALQSPEWSRSFRHIEQIRKFYINEVDGEPQLIIETNLNTEARKNLIGKIKECEGFILNKDNYSIWLTEKNIELLYDTLAPMGFDIDERIKTHYNTIKSWSLDTVKSQFKITSMTNANFQKHITADLGMETSIDQNIINDRSLRYQYFTDDAKTDDSLTTYIANRSKPKVWVDKQRYQLTELLESLKELRRLPIMFVFDTQSEEHALGNLKLLNNALQDAKITDGVGVYFRLPNSELGKQFNQVIATNRYNSRLDQNTNVVAVQSGKIPKFFLTNDWRPMSVIALDTHMGLRHGKTSVYASYCDLLVSYNDEAPIVEKMNKWL